jgi:nucleotide-binding universal stress UspA family protein
MKRFKNILVIPATLSADDPAIARAARLARSNGARLTVAWPMDEGNGSGVTLDLQRDIIEGLQEELEQVVRPIREMHLPVETMVLVGRPFTTIITQVLRHAHDLVIKTARGRQLFRSLFFGTTALHLLRKCPCPVWIVHPQPKTLAGGILAAVDPDTTDPAVLQVNNTLMELATSLALFEKMPLHVAHAWTVPYEDMIRHSPWLKVSRTTPDTYSQEIEERHRQRLDALLARYKSLVPTLTVHFVKGLAEDVIPELAKALKVEVIVMATLARSGVPGLLIGNTAENILGQVSCSVLTVKPDDFVSPVAA